MEIGNEISQKVRSAIKAKLVDLGAYVDDELPDYIMVMVANKKTREQMTDDLNLFLGNNTERFTSWLSTLLEKLHSVAETSAAHAKSTESVKDKPETPASSDNRSTSNNESAKMEIPVESSRTKGSSALEQSAPTKKTVPGDGTRKRVMTEANPVPHTGPQDVKKSRVINSGEKDKTDSATTENVPEILISAEKDLLFEEEVEASSKKVAQLPRQASNSKDRSSKGQVQAASKTAVTSPVRVIKEVVPPKGRTSISRTSSDHRTRTSKSGESDVGGSSSDSSRRKRPLSSAIGAIVKRPSQDVEEEPYDPYRPSIGKVASQVKITERKSKVPATWQADKSILLKAVSAAEHSIEKSKKAEKAVVKPVSQDLAPRKHRSSVHQRLSHRSHSPPRGLRSDRYPSRRSPPPRHRESRSERISGERRIQVFSRSKADEVFSRLRSKVMVKKAEEAAETGKEDEEEGDKDSKASSEKSQADSDAGNEGGIEQVAPEDVLDLTIPEDNRLIEYELDDDLADKPLVPPYKATPISHGLGLLVESGAEESDFTDGEGEDSRIVKEQQKSARLNDRPESPKFVVTLDGVDPTLLKKEVKFDCDSDHEVEPESQSPPKPERNIVRVEPRPQRPMIQPTTVVNLQDDDLEDEDIEMIDVSELPEKPTVVERCHFWPSCKNGDTCAYHHPTEPCRNFPKCKFGDKCLYVHPSCKFDANCTKPKCPFVHTSKKPASAFAPPVPLLVQPIKVPVFSGGFFRPPRHPRPPAPQHPSQITCKFFPECTNMSCQYNHPKPCRFGVSCNIKATCHFTHPKLPSKDQLTWAKGSKSQASFLPSPDVSAVLMPNDRPLTSTPKT